MPPDEVQTFRRCLVGALPSLIALSFLSNLSILVSPIFMMQVFDRVVGTGNLDTLALLALIATGLLVGITVTDLARDRALSALGLSLRTRVAELPRPAQTAGRPTTDTATSVHQFMVAGGIQNALNAIWLPLLFALLALIHPLFAIVGLCGGLLLLAISQAQHLRGERIGLTMRPDREKYGMTQRALDDAAPLRDGMGIRRNLGRVRTGLMRTLADQELFDIRQRATLTSLQVLLRSLAQIGLLSAGAVLTVQGSVTAGATIAASLLGAKAIATTESLARIWRELSEFRTAMRQLDDPSLLPTEMRTDVATLSGAITVDGVTVPRSPGAPPRLNQVSVSIAPGECVALLGESGAGKSTLIEALSGLMPAPIGSVRYDSTDVRTLPQDRLHRLIGIVPQGATLLHGTLAENISRWDPARSDEAIIEAARMAGVHGFVSALPAAYETRLPDDRHLISPGLAQRIALARAFYGKPRLLFLDEPNAMLDPSGERFLLEALARMKADGTTIAMSLHRGAIVGLADRIIVLDRGRVADSGPRREVMERLDRGTRKLHLPASLQSADDLADWLRTQFRRAEDADLRERTVASARDLFAFAIANGPSSRNRKLTFEFRFLEDTTCELRLSEPRGTRLQAKIDSVRKTLRNPTASPESLPPDEAALANVIGLSERFEFRSAAQSSVFVSTLTLASTQGALH
ncbi:MAG: hypothetical protein RLZZ528_1461 [Pseudomonadota bacterium]